MCLKLEKPIQKVHTVIVDDECGCYGSSSVKSEDQEEEKLGDFEEFAVHEYNMVLGLQCQMPASTTIS